MSETRILDMDPQTGIVRLFHYDDTNDTFTIETRQTVDDIVEVSKATYNSIDERANWKGDLHLVGRIPLTLFYELQRRGEVDADGNVLNDETLAKFLNNPDYRDFRTRPGRV